VDIWPYIETEDGGRSKGLSGKGGTLPQGTTTTRQAPTSHKWSYNLYKWPYKWVTGVITLLIGGITPFINDRGPPCRGNILRVKKTHTSRLADSVWVY